MVGAGLDAATDHVDDFGAVSAFAPRDDLGGEPTPALLAARAEPLGDAPTERRAAGKTPRASRPPRASQSSRKQKAPDRRAPKSGDNNKAGLVVGLLAVALLGIGAAYLLTRGDDEGTTTGEDVASGDTASSLTVPDSPAEAEVTTSLAAAASPEAVRPYVILDEAAIGPILSETPYTLGVGGQVPDGAMYQLFVDDIPTAEAAPELAPAVFTPGRHLLVVQITSATASDSTDPVLVYALGAMPESGYVANLSSVNIDAEGWSEAVRQFDDYVASGHTDAQLMPSVWFDGVPVGYWNITVGGFTSSQEALDYCEQSGMAVPDECFARLVEPASAAGG